MVGLAPEALGERVLATVLFSDIVGSTAALDQLGDHAWASVLHEHNVRIRAAIGRFRVSMPSSDMSTVSSPSPSTVTSRLTTSDSS